MEPYTDAGKLFIEENTYNVLELRFIFRRNVLKGTIDHPFVSTFETFFAMFAMVVKMEESVVKVKTEIFCVFSKTIRICLCLFRFITVFKPV